ncbi:uncharacterized protein RHO25_006817 [Cercospora beticola]|uniref:Uncharacterized protein n=1 Tax=Cercospora beticola TaxID=122368 RepID=A0ABZ0NRI1_CERBT|nr:hypothetical protein RHO25_006817 [Cercospora beticola]CAK1362958.1 unnamed protein product [Cercospora beticola]
MSQHSRNSNNNTSSSSLYDDSPELKEVIDPSNKGTRKQLKLIRHLIDHPKSWLNRQKLRWSSRPDGRPQYATPEAQQCMDDKRADIKKTKAMKAARAQREKSNGVWAGLSQRTDESGVSDDGSC